MQPDFDSVDGLRDFLRAYPLTPESVQKFINANQGENDGDMIREYVCALISSC
jgi:hypothetical protein